MSPADLLARVAGHGFRVEVDGDTGPYLVRVVRGVVLPADLIAALRANREAVLRYVTCSTCGRVTTSREDRERLRDCAFCDRAKCPHKAR